VSEEMLSRYGKDRFAVPRSPMPRGGRPGHRSKQPVLLLLSSTKGVVARTLSNSCSREPHQPPLRLTPAAHPVSLRRRDAALIRLEMLGSYTNGECVCCGAGSSDSCVAWLGHGAPTPARGRTWSVTLRCGEKWQSPPSQPTADPAYFRRTSLGRYSIFALARNCEPTRTDMSTDVVRGELAGRLCGGKLDDSPPNAA